MIALANHSTNTSHILLCYLVICSLAHKEEEKENKIMDRNFDSPPSFWGEANWLEVEVERRKGGGGGSEEKEEVLSRIKKKKFLTVEISPNFILLQMSPIYPM